MNNYLVTVEVKPAYPYMESFIETVEMQSLSGEMGEIDDRLGGYTNSPIHKLMMQYDIEIVDNFKVIRIEDITNPNTKTQRIPESVSGRLKRYDEIYGYWITDEGELIPVDYCGHTKINSNGYRDGWIAVITQNEWDLSFRFFENDVTKEALISLLDIIRKSNYPTYYCDFGLSDNTMSDKRFASKVEVIKQIKILIEGIK